MRFGLGGPRRPDKTGWGLSAPQLPPERLGDGPAWPGRPSGLNAVFAVILAGAELVSRLVAGDGGEGGDDGGVVATSGLGGELGERVGR